MEVGAASAEAVAGFVRALLRAARTLRTYPASNEISQRALDALGGQLAQVLPLRLELRSDQILVADQPLLDDKDRSELVTALYADGIRRIDLQDGFDREELERFVCVLARPVNPDDLSEDYVTHLWEAELAHVHVAAIDPYLDVDLPEDVLEGKETPSGESEDVGRLERPDVAPPPESAFRITEDDRLRVEKELDETVDAPPWLPFVEALFETLHSPVGARRPEDVVQLVEECFQRLIADLRFDVAERLLVRLSERPPEPAKKLLRGAIGRMVDPSRLAPLHHALETESADRKVLGSLLLRMSPFVCETICVFLGDSAQEASRRFYADLLVHVGTRSLPPVLEHFAAAEGDVKLALVRVLGRLRAAEATRALLDALPAAEPPLRREIARALAQVRSPEALATLLDLGLADSDGRTRLIALRGLGESRGRLDPRRLLEHIRSPRFRSIAEEEKELLFATLGSIGSDAVVPFLAEMLSPPWWSWRSRPAEWKRASLALARIGSPKAREVLERGSTSRRRELSALCARALGTLEREGGA